MQHLNKSRDDQWFDMTWTSNKRVEDDDPTNYSQVNLENSTQVNINNTAIEGTSSPLQVAHKKLKWELSYFRKLSLIRNIK